MFSLFVGLFGSAVLGVLVSAGLSWLMPPQKAAQLAVGAFSAGLVMGYILTRDALGAVLCGFAAVIGWAIYRVVTGK